MPSKTLEPAIAAAAPAGHRSRNWGDMLSAKLVCRSALVLLFCGCAVPTSDPPLITDIEAVAAHEGHLVTLRGELRSVKWSTVLGVCVEGEPFSRNGALVEATGVLIRRHEPAPASVWDSDSRPYGTYFVLRDQRVPARLARVRFLHADKPQEATGR